MPQEELKAQAPDPNYKNSWYAVTPNRLLVTLGSLKGEINCDVCVIGAGFTGISAAFELVQKGYSVTLLEGKNIIDSATAHNSSHLLRGYHHSPGYLSQKYSPAGAKMLCNMTLEGLALIVERIAKHDIKCDLKFGHLTAALNNHDATSLKQRMAEWGKLGHTDLKYIPKKEIHKYVDSAKYIGGLFDPKGAHFHPINYAMGVLQTAQNSGCKIYDETQVTSITQGNTVRIQTKNGAVNAKFVILSGFVRIPGLSILNKKIFAASVPMIATQPLPDRVSHKISPRNYAIVDSCRIMNYFKFSSDNRLLFGSAGQGINLRQRMTALFPDLKDAKIAHEWSNHMDFTLNAMPNMGRYSANIFYAQGYCGQGVILGNLAGKLIAEVVSGTTERFDIFAKIGHMSIPAGDTLKQRILALGMAWYRLQDSLL